MTGKISVQKYELNQYIQIQNSKNPAFNELLNAAQKSKFQHSMAHKVK